MRYAILFFCTLASIGQAWSPYHETHMENGRSVIVQLFEWRFDDIGQECERFLGPKGFGAVQVSPVLEHIQSEGRPWWDRYQVVSYKIISRSGTQDQFADMVNKCNAAGVRIYVDFIPNHMTGHSGNGSGYGIGGTYWNGAEYDYPGVSYTKENFNGREKCGTPSGGIEDYSKAWQNRNCELMGLRDLDQSQEYVRRQIVAAMDSLTALGVAGFRIDASKHMWPEEMKLMFEALSDVNATLYGANKKPFIYHEIAYSPGEVQASEYTQLGRPIEFRFSNELQHVVKKEYGKKMAHLKNYGQEWGFLPTEDAVVIVDNHDIQRATTGLYPNVVYFRQPKWHKMITEFMLAWPYGTPKVMSSYHWPEYIENGKDKNNWIGPPHEANFDTKWVKVNPDDSCAFGWVCEHRWRPIANMVEFRNVAGDEPVVGWWDNGGHAIAFGRQGRAFIAMNNDDSQLIEWFWTSLPEGEYCDVISGGLYAGHCTGRQIRVNSHGYAFIDIQNGTDDPVIAFHIKSKL
ncbi:Alpha-amylase 1 [Halotydeus destructor]|nr:Alpha-amylase 1 [Halotydeus destructor]